jgi:pyridoxal phosphate enzyme (YggS family)
MDTSDVIDRLHMLQKEVETLARSYPLAGSPVIEAVSKGQPVSKIQALLSAGHRHFAENRLQEAQAHWHELLPHFPDLQLHYVGALQSNKLRKIVALFTVIETVASIDMAQHIDKEAARINKKQRIMLQVNIGEEPQKEGVMPQQLQALYDTCAALPHVEVIGLMCVPPVNAPPTPYFALMHQWQQRLRLPCLSMGMSGDYAIAVRFGATHVRLGTALYGERN